MALFHPFRALGYITDDVPFAVQRRGKETFVTVSVGNAWQIYNCSKLRLSLVGPQLSGSIRALACKNDLTFAAVGSEITVCQRVHRIATCHGHTGPIVQLLCLADHLLSLGADRKLLLWRIGDYEEPEVEIDLGEAFTPTCMAHPDTYINKVIIGGKGGQMQLWNFVTGKLLYQFKGLGADVACVESSPALDVIGIGLSDGRAMLHNLKYDEQVMGFSNASGSGAKNDLFLAGTAKLTSGPNPCTSISFRTGAGVPLMAAGGGAGVVTVWNLEERRLHTILRDAHDAPLLRLHFFAGEPLLMSAAADNSLKQWLFDAPDGSARLLRFRSGHSAPPTSVRYYASGRRLLSAGQDRAFRLFSTVQDQQSRELSQGHTQRRAKRLKVAQEELKLPPLTAMDACEVRERDWCNVITAHEGDTAAYTWRLQSYSQGQHVLRPAGQDGSFGTAPQQEDVVTAVAMSRCGNFGLVGSAGGAVNRYNMQSGLHRGTFQRPAAGPAKQPARPAHDGPVTGLAPDACNRCLITAGADSTLRWWDFKRRSLQREVVLPSPVTRVAHHPGSALLAVACADRVLRMYDAETAKLVRQFRGHTDAITDLAISEDARWLLSSSRDGTVRVFDIPSSRLLQVFQFPSPVVSLSLSPGLDMLATAHTGLRGIYLWANQLIFGSRADITPSTRPFPLPLPTITTGAEAEGEELSDEEDAAALAQRDAGQAGEEARGWAGPGASGAEDLHKPYEERDAAGAPAPLDPTLVTLSALPRPQWHNLAHLDAIKVRNRPIQPPTKPQAAPFFLPTIAGVSGTPVFDTSARAGLGDELAAAADAGGPAGKAAASRVMHTQGVAPVSDMLQLLRDGASSGDYTQLVAYLRGMAPTALDSQLQAMQVIEGVSSAEEIEDLGRLLDFLAAEVVANRNFEFMQAVLRLVLQIHGDAIMALPVLRARGAALRVRLAASWARVDELLQSVRCMVNYFGNLQT